MKIISYSKLKLVIILVIAYVFSGCEQEELEDALAIADGGGTLTTYKAYAIDSVAGFGEVYGRAVFWKGMDGKTLLQLSLYNIMEAASHPSAIFSGALPGGGELMSLYDIINTGEGYDFGEFSVSKFYVIDEPSFFEGLDAYDANIQIMMSPSDNTVIAAGDIGLNATPVETSL